jgi:hypothetical protein
MWSIGGGDRWIGRRRRDGGRYGRDGICGKQAISDSHAESDAERGREYDTQRRRDPAGVRNCEPERDINARRAVAIWSNGKSSLP